MQTQERIQRRFRDEIRRSWFNWLCDVPSEQKSRPWHGGKNLYLLAEWSGADETEGANYSHRLKQWMAVGPSTDELLGKEAEVFRLFCENIGIDFDELLSGPPIERREVFKSRLTQKLAQYKVATGRSMKALAEHLGWSSIDYQWLRRIKANGSDHARTKKQQLDQLAQELGTTVDHLFGLTDDLPTMDVIVSLGIEEFASRQPEGSRFCDPQKVREFLNG